MVGFRVNRAVLFVLLACLAVVVLPQTSSGQTQERVTTSVDNALDVDLEVELHVLVASNSPESGKLPGLLEGVARELRPSLPFTNYRLGASFLSRVKNGRSINVRGVGRSLLVTPALESSVLPTFYEISAGMMNLKTDASGRAVVQVTAFRFGLRIPLQTGSGQSTEGGERNPTIVYEPVGITTDITIREGEAAVVGTLDAGRPNESLVLVLVARRVS